MNRAEVIIVIKNVGDRFANVMATACGDEFAAGYKRAIIDMATMFDKAPLDADFEAEREAMLKHIEMLEIKNEELEQEVCSKHAQIQELLKHVNLAEVLGVTAKPKRARKLSF